VPSSVSPVIGAGLVNPDEGRAPPALSLPCVSFSPEFAGAPCSVYERGAFRSNLTVCHVYSKPLPLLSNLFSEALSCSPSNLSRSAPPDTARRRPPAPTTQILSSGAKQRSDHSSESLDVTANNITPLLITIFMWICSAELRDFAKFCGICSFFVILSPKGEESRLDKKDPLDRRSFQLQHKTLA
jgi:hypothetical protein